MNDIYLRLEDIYTQSYSETLGKKTNSTPSEKGGRAPVSQRNDQAPHGVGISVVKSSLGRSDPASPSSLSRSIYVLYLLENKFRRANSGFLLIAEQGGAQGRRPPFLV